MPRSFILRVLLAVALVLGAVLPLALWTRRAAPGLEGTIALPADVTWQEQGFVRLDAFANGELIWGTTCETETGEFFMEVVESEIGRRLQRIELEYSVPGLGTFAVATLNLDIEITEDPVDLGTVQLELVQALVAGSVRDSDGGMVDDASVSLEAFDERKGRWRSIESASLTRDGHFRFGWRAEERRLRVSVLSFDCEPFTREFRTERELEIVLDRLAIVALSDVVAKRVHPAFEVTVVGTGEHAGRVEAFPERPLVDGTTISCTVPAGTWGLELRTRGQGATALALGAREVERGAELAIDVPVDVDPWAHAERVVVTVVDEAGVPVPGVELDFGARTLGAELRTAPGRFELARVPGTPQRFTVRAEGFVPVELTDPETETLVRLEGAD